MRLCMDVLFLFTVMQLSKMQALKDINYVITENIQANEVIGNIAEDCGLNSKYDDAVLLLLQYRFLAQPQVNVALGGDGGVLLITGGQIDRDRVCPSAVSCNLRIDVAVRPVQYFHIIKVTLEIRDRNDNIPQFTPNAISYSVLESAMPKTFFTLPRAVDFDSPRYGIQKYMLYSQESMFELYYKQKLDGSMDVRLVLARSLDREKQDLYTVTVMAVDGGTPSQSGLLEVEISVLDANDNQPIFENRTYNVLLSENTPLNTRILQVRAHDADAGLNAMVSYCFTQRTLRNFGHLFGIRNSTGEIFVKGNLDYESSPTYHLNVIALDAGPDAIPADTTVTITLRDQNDHAPKITLNTISARGTTFAKIMENSDNGTFVGHITVKDPDHKSNGRFHCHIDSKKFRLQWLYTTEYKLVSNAVLDRESQSLHHVALTCLDEGDQPRVATKYVKIYVIDDNDHAPQFSQLHYTVHIKENNFIGAFILQLNATDLDEGNNGHVEYELEGKANMYLTVDRLKGTLTAKQSFDHERLSRLKFRVLARDRGSPAKVGVAQITIKIDDVNDNAPSFDQKSYFFSLYENSPRDFEVGMVRAFDQDSEPFNKFAFYLEPERAAINRFSIDTDSGMVFTRTVLDREQHSVYYLVCVVKDRSSQPKSTSVSVTISVMDINDNSPRLQFPTRTNDTIRISAHIPVSQFVTRVFAHDSDLGKNAKLTYVFIDGNQLNIFNIHALTGVITVVQELHQIHYAQFNLTVLVSDHGQPSRTTRGRLKVVVNGSLPYIPNTAHSVVSKHVFLLSSIAVTVLFLLSVAAAITYLWLRKSGSFSNGSKRDIPVAMDMNNVSMNLKYSSPNNCSNSRHVANSEKDVWPVPINCSVDIRGETFIPRVSSAKLELRNSLASIVAEKETQQANTLHDRLGVSKPVSCSSPLLESKATAITRASTPWEDYSHDKTNQQSTARWWHNGDAQSERSFDTCSNTDSGQLICAANLQ